MISRDSNDLRVKPAILSRPIEPVNDNSSLSTGPVLSKSTKKSKSLTTPCLSGTARLALPQHSRLLGAALAHENR